MSNKLIVAIVVVLLAVIGFGLFGTRDDSQDLVLDKDPVEPITEMIANHYFNEGTHTIEGTLTLPTPCHDLDHNVAIAESFPEQVTVHFTTTEGAELCVQTIADKFYRVTFEASENASISATLNGLPISLTFADDFDGITK